MAGEVPFIFRWCDKYGLSEETSAVLLAHGFNSVAELQSFSYAQIKDLPLPTSQRLVLRGALLQFVENDLVYAQRRARKLGAPVEQTLFYTKRDVLDHQANSQHFQPKESLTPEEAEKRLALRRRVRHRKRGSGDAGGAGAQGQSLADRIFHQRQTLVSHQDGSFMGGSEISLMSASSGDSGTSRTSASTLPAGHVTEPSLAKHRETRSAADAHQRVAPKGDNDNLPQDNDNLLQDIEDILRDDPDPQTARSQSRSSRSGSKSQPRSSTSVSRSSTSVLRSPVNPALTPDPAVNPEAEDPTDDMVFRMDAALERLLKEITDSTPATSRVRRPRGDVKAALDILDKDLLTDDERRLLAEVTSPAQ